MGLVSTIFLSHTGAPLVKPLPVNPTDPAVTGPDIFAKLVPMAAHEASSLYRWVGGAGPVLCTGGIGMSQETWASSNCSVTSPAVRRKPSCFER